MAESLKVCFSRSLFREVQWSLEVLVEKSVGWKNEVDICTTHENSRCEWWIHL